MPKYYCDYCDTFLTHDSPSVRKTHNGGRKHKENVRLYYQTWMEEQAQKLVDATTKAFTQQQRLAQSRAPMMPPVQPPQAIQQFAYPGVPGTIPRPQPIGGMAPGMPPMQIPGGYQQVQATFAGGIIPALPPMPYNAN